MTTTFTFNAWELETIFHLASNAARKASSPHFEKLNELASKAISNRQSEYPDYLNQYRSKA